MVLGPNAKPKPERTSIKIRARLKTARPRVARRGMFDVLTGVWVSISCLLNSRRSQRCPVGLGPPGRSKPEFSGGAAYRPDSERQDAGDEPQHRPHHVGHVRVVERDRASDRAS